MNFSNSSDDLSNLGSSSAWPVDDVLIGVTYCLIAVIDLILYVPIMIVFRDADLSKKDSYIFMFHMGVSDMVQACMHFVGGILTILPVKMSDVPHQFDATCGGLLSTGWLVYLHYNSLLAINRLAHVAIPHRIEEIFSHRTMKIIVFLSYVYGGAWMGAYLSPNIKFIYQKEVYLYYYDGSKQSGVAHTIDAYIGRAQIAVMGICYAAIILLMRAMRKRMQNDSVELKQARRRELKITAQMSILFLLTFTLQMAWTIIPTVITNMTKYVYATLNACWIVINGANPIIYFSLNP
uniref:Vomeronasal type-1 receptor n=1 Tax=Plectus sambesii TaxID=2011161 RepID=A0A914WZH3_9BILA